jgi:tetratricopeptide (TPR) repeat protein
MAEGLFEGALGGEEDKPEVEASEPVVGVEAFAAAIAAKLAGNDPGVARKTEEFLSDQSQLLKVQKRHLEEEHEARLHFLRGQAREVDIRRFGLRLRVGFQLFLVLVASVIGTGAIVLVHDAITSRRVIVEAFEVAPALVARGVSGTVVAGAFLDDLGRLQRATRTSSYAAAKRELSSAWASEPKIEVPDTGISISEISRLLKNRFGNDLHIGGSVIVTESGGLVLTVRGDGIEPKTFGGTASDLQKLTTAATEYIYAQSQPVLWAIYLDNEARYEDEVAFVKSVYAGANAADRPYLLNIWANGLTSIERGTRAEPLKLYQAALKLKPDFWAAASNVDLVLVFQGKEEEAWRHGETMRQLAGGRPGRASEPYYSSWDGITWNLPQLKAAYEADSDANGGIGTSGTPNGPLIAQTDALLHDPSAAELAIKIANPDSNDPTVIAGIHLARGLVARETGDLSLALTQMEALNASLDNPQTEFYYAPWRCWAASLEEAAGHPDKADAVFKTGGTFVDCYRFHGDILDGRGDWQGAQEWYTKAVDLAPDLPAGYYSWGVALAKHGDLAGAEAKLRAANQRGPHWADPLKAWGDVLAKQGKTTDALAKYDEALKYAPNWKQLEEAREAVAKQKG